MRVVLFLTLLAALGLPAPQASAETAAEKVMAQQIGRQLKESGQLRDYRIAVKYQDGVVWLGGNVTDPGQREIAVQLAEQMEGVSRVICQLECNGGTITAPAQHSPNLFNSNSANQRAAAQQGGNRVVQAIADNGYAAQRPPAVNRTSLQARVAKPSSRSNMPLPSARMAGGSAGPSGVRQASAQTAYQAGGGMYAEGCAPGPGGGMGGQFAGGPGGPGAAGGGMGAVPVGFVPHGSGRGPSYENAQMPGYAWPSYASYPNYAALTYPKQYSPTAWPYIGPFYPYPQVPLAWRKVSLEWDDGWWFLDFSAHNSTH